MTFRTQNTRALDLATLTPRDALDLAIVIEEEAKERYDELASQMELHHNPEAARFFRRMWEVEAKHERLLAERRVHLFGAEPQRVSREMIFDIEAPEYDEVRANLTLQSGLEIALRAETKAHDFFAAAAQVATLQEVRDLFSELRDEELGHQALVQRELDKLPEEPATRRYGDEDEDEDIVAL